MWFIQGKISTRKISLELINPCKRVRAGSQHNSLRTVQGLKLDLLRTF